MSKIIISNIAWENNEETTIFEYLNRESIFEIEIAITKYFDGWNFNIKDLYELRDYFKKYNISVYSIQSIFYGLDYNLFINNDLFLMHISKIIEYAKILNAKRIVFGSPKNRFLINNDYTAIYKDIFIDTLNNINIMCNGLDLKFCIEPNSKKYGCNFITNSDELYHILKNINHKNIKMHLDSACMHLESDSPSNIEKYGTLLEHFHISEPYLNNFEKSEVNHELYSFYLKNIKYNKVMSIEMKSSNNNINSIIRAVNFSKINYG